MSRFHELLFVAVTASTRLRDVPAARRRALETLLHNSADDSWKRLAKRLGQSLLH